MRFFLTFICCTVCSLSIAQVDAPPAYPRDGAKKIFENDSVIVWNISWLKGEYPVHRHRYDHTGVYFSPGDRIITSVDGEAREVHTDPWNISFQLAGVTHTESGLSEEPLRAVFIQIKRPVAGAITSDSALPSFPHDQPLNRRANDRVRVWEYNSATANDSRAHIYLHDAVVVWFDRENQPNVHFVPSGTVQTSDAPSAASRTFVFEIL